MILDYFLYNKKPREIQKEVLSLFEESFDKYDVFVFNLPVASGKSYIALTIQHFLLKEKKLLSRIITSNNILVNQYKQEFNYLHVLPAAESTTCIATKVNNCAQQKAVKKFYCVDCPYFKAKKRGYVYPFGVYNIYTYFANGYYRPILLIDEAHTLHNIFSDFISKKFWHHDYNFPKKIYTYQQLLDWAYMFKQLNTKHKKLNNKLDILINSLQLHKYDSVVEMTEDYFRGELKPVIKLLPLDVRSVGDKYIWPQNKVKKLILLSATFNKQDLIDLGLNNKKVLILTGESCIPPENRPIVFLNKTGLYMNYNNIKHNLINIKNLILFIINKYPNKKGVVHLTYALMKELYPLFNNQKDFIFFFSKEEKEEAYIKFLNSSPPKVLFAAGMYEGIDLPKDLGTYQIITKVPYPSLSSPAMRHIAQENPKKYANYAVRQLVQASGRICRTPDDYGITYIIDKCFEKLYNNHNDLFPSFFKESLINE